MAEAVPLLSLIVPAYNERESAPEIVAFFRAVAAAHAGLAVELVVVDDGSEDGTAEAITAATRPGEPVRVVRLSRNFGSHAAITAGLTVCAGDAALTLSADLQEPLSAVQDFVTEWRTGGDIVWGLRSVRAAGGVNDLFARMFSMLYQRSSEVPTYPREGPSQILLSRAVIDVIVAMPELNRNVLAMAAWSGFTQRRVFFRQLPRPYGKSKWTTKKKVKLVIDSFVEFSAAPIQWLSLLGMGLGAAGVLTVLLGVILAVAGIGLSSGFVILGGVVLVVGGLILLGLGTVGEYVWRAGDDARRRPLFVIQSIQDNRVGRENR